jgi:hypothetical protein
MDLQQAGRNTVKAEWVQLETDLLEERLSEAVAQGPGKVLCLQAVRRVA